MTQGQVALKVDLSSGKYISEIERGLRDLPITTLRDLVERGLGSSLADLFAEERAKRKSQPIEEQPPLPRAVEDVARSIAGLPVEKRGHVLATIRRLLAAAR